MSNLFSRMQQRYRDCALPWDDPLPPPEVIELVNRLEPGHVLDLGCGPGRVCIYLARYGWQCTGVDFVSEAIDMALERAECIGVADSITFHLSSVTTLDFLAEPYDLAIDIGCMHAQPAEDLPLYAAEVARLVRPGGYYLLFARLSDEWPRVEHSGVPERIVRELFADTFTCEHVEHGITETSVSTWQSAWFWMVRLE